MTNEELQVDMAQDIFNAMKTGLSYIDGRVNTGNGSFYTDDWLFAEADRTAKEIIRKYNLKPEEK